MEETTKNNFLGVEKVGKLMKMFAIPCVLSLIIQQRCFTELSQA